MARWTVGLVASRATAACATAILDKLFKVPFPVRGAQVDGGSEFPVDFESSPKDRKINPFVPPRKRIQHNGCVEQAQGSWRYEFYACFDLPSRLDHLPLPVDAFAHHRLDEPFAGQPRAEYPAILSAGEPSPSQIC